MAKPCSAAVLRNLPYGPCANGFPMMMSCLTGRGVPMCLQEELCGRRYSENGGKPAQHMVAMGRAALTGGANG